MVRTKAFAKHRNNRRKEGTLASSFLITLAGTTEHSVLDNWEPTSATQSFLGIKNRRGGALLNPSLAKKGVKQCLQFEWTRERFQFHFFAS